MIQFEVGKHYDMVSPAQINCAWYYRVTKRTDKNVWLMPVDRDGVDQDHKPQRCKLYVQHRGQGYEEFCRPLGSYSMAPTLFASRTVGIGLIWSPGAKK